jgi:hypothetical protein
VDRIAAWNGWFEDMADRVVERGKPVADARAIGNCGEGTRIGGYSIVTAKDLQEAVEVAKGCPGLGWGGGVEVGEFSGTRRAPRPWTFTPTCCRGCRRTRLPGSTPP